MESILANELITRVSIAIVSFSVGVTVMYLRGRRGKRRQTLEACDRLTKSAKNVELLALALKGSSGSVADLSEKQSLSLKALDAETQTIVSDLDRISGRSDKTREIADHTLDRVREGGRSLKVLADQLDRVAADTKVTKTEVSENLANLSKASEVIRDINTQTATLGEIVFQAKLLSFNASVEAARAGDYGKGFAVVADEIGAMARASGAAAGAIEAVLKSGLTQVEGLIESLQVNVRSALDQMAHRIEQSALESKKTEAIFADIANAANASQAQASEAAIDVKGVDRSVHTISAKISGNVSDLESMQSHVKKSKTGSENLGKEVETLNQVISDLLFEVTGEKINDILPKDVLQKYSHCRIIDVRRPEEFNDDLGHIKGAELLTLDDNFEDKLSALDPGAPTIFVCRSGGRSSRACRIARASGFKKIFNMQGGMLAWAQEKLPTH